MHPLEDFETHPMATPNQDNVDKLYNNNESAAVYFYTQPAYSSSFAKTFAYQPFYHQQYQETSSDVEYLSENVFLNSECFRSGAALSPHVVERFYCNSREGVQKSDVESMKRHDCFRFCNSDYPNASEVSFTTEFSERSDRKPSEQINQLFQASGDIQGKIR